MGRRRRIYTYPESRVRRLFVWQKINNCALWSSTTKNVHFFAHFLMNLLLETCSVKIMRIRLFLLIAFLLILMLGFWRVISDRGQHAAQSKVVFYEPEEVELSGILHKEVYPGPPEYMSIEMGDRPEEVIILTLKNPIDVVCKVSEDPNEPEENIYELQVVFASSTPLISPLMGQEITLRGSLYHAHTAHHRRNVLMTVEGWKPK